MQRPDVIRHQHFTDAFDGERRNFRRGDGKRLRLENRPDQTAEHGNRDESATPVEAAIFFDITSRQQDREDDQDRHRADVNEDLHQSYKLRAEQKEECSDPHKRHRKTERRVHELLQGCGRQSGGQRENGNDNKRDAVHSAKR